MINKLHSSFKKLAAKRAVRRILPFASAALLVVLVVLAQVVLTSDSPTTNAADSDTYKQELHGQTTAQDGAPRDGRDPAAQQQNSLASAASKPTGVGQRVDKPAASVSGGHEQHHDHSSQSEPEQAALGTNGCFVDYGIQGEQCLPAHAATNGTVTCDSVHAHGFPGGIKVTGQDRFHLDTNHDGTACNTGD